jgi:hypothetical protein
LSSLYWKKIYRITYTIRKCVDGAYGIYITNSIQVEQIWIRVIN